MKVSVSELEARALMTQLPNTPECKALKTKLANSLVQNRALTAAELEAVLVVMDRTAWPEERKGALVSAAQKLRALHQQQLAREQGGRS